MFLGASSCSAPMSKNILQKDQTQKALEVGSERILFASTAAQQLLARKNAQLRAGLL